MFLIYLLFIVNLLGSDQITIISKSDLNSAVDKIQEIFPTINPDIAEDINLTTVLKSSDLFNLELNYELIISNLTDLLYNCKKNEN